MSDGPDGSRSLGLLASGGGEMGASIRARDRATPLGSPRAWPRGLSAAGRMALNTCRPTLKSWRPEHVCLYNHGYRPSLGSEKHPSILGAPGREAWPET